MPSFVCEAVLFDLDGVLVDSGLSVSRIWMAWATEHGLDPEYVVHVTHGRRTIETVRKVAPQLDAQHETDKIEQREMNDTHGLRVLPGAKELLASLPPDRYAVVTSGTRRLATKRLQVAGLPVPAGMTTADDVVKGKPHPEPYLTGARRLGREPGKCLVFEDAPSGIVAAKAAGMTVIAISNTYPPDELSEADLVIESLLCLSVQIEASGDVRLVAHEFAGAAIRSSE